MKRDYWLAWSLGLCVGIVVTTLAAILVMTWGLV